MPEPIKVDTEPKVIHADFPGNSHKQRTQKVTEGNVSVRKRGLGKAVAESFAGESRKNVGEYILFDVLIPAAKVALIDGLEMFLGIDSRNRRDRRFDRRDTPQAPRVSYGSYYDDRRGGASKREEERSIRSRNGMAEDLVFSSRADAIGVLSQIVDILDEYRSVTVADYYGAAGVKSEYVDENYGWTNLRDAKVIPVRSGYVIDLPRPVRLS